MHLRSQRNVLLSNFSIVKNLFLSRIFFSIIHEKKNGIVNPCIKMEQSRNKMLFARFRRILVDISESKRVDFGPRDIILHNVHLRCGLVFFSQGHSLVT